MEPKKISFGFSKLSRKTIIISNNLKQDKKVELIECLEGQSIKVKDAVEEVKQPLVIPIKDNQKNLFDRIKDAKKRDRPQDPKKTEPEDHRPDSELTVDELAARQLIQEAKVRLTEENNINDSKISVLPLNQETPSLEGEKEPTLEDYESVPIGDYGLALLRGMGWKEGMTVGRNTSKTVSISAPELRPKGLGLGATKVIQSEIPIKKPVDKDGKELILIKGAYAKLIAGVKKGNYCEVQGFDEEAGRVIVKVYPKGDNLNVNEFMLIPVTKEEFSKGSKILNNAKYEEYLEISEKKLEKYRIKQEPLKSDNMKEHTQESNFKDEREARQRDDHTRTKYKSEPSDNEYETEKKLRSHTKSKYRDRSRSRSSSRHKGKKDKDRRRLDYSSDSEYSEKEWKDKHSKSKYRDRSQDESISREKHKKDKKHKSMSRQDSSSESDSRRDKRKKNKCKSRHRRNSSSSSVDRKSYRSKK